MYLLIYLYIIINLKDVKKHKHSNTVLVKIKTILAPVIDIFFITKKTVDYNNQKNIFKYFILFLKDDLQCTAITIINCYKNNAYNYYT